MYQSIKLLSKFIGKHGPDLEQEADIKSDFVCFFTTAWTHWLSSLRLMIAQTSSVRDATARLRLQPAGRLLWVITC